MKRESSSITASSVPKKTKTIGHSSRNSSQPSTPPSEPQEPVIEKLGKQGVEHHRSHQKVWDIIEAKKERTFSEDYGIDIEHIPDAVPKFHAELIRRNWLNLTQSRPINDTLVGAFYAYGNALPKR